MYLRTLCSIPSSHLSKAAYSTAAHSRCATRVPVALSNLCIPSVRKVYRRRTSLHILLPFVLWRLWDTCPPRALIRSFTTATAEASQDGTSRCPTLLVVAPKLEHIDSQEVALPDSNNARIQMTERAAEKLHAISASENNPSLALRIAVESGGCHGYQYKMELTSGWAPDDYKFIHPAHGLAAVVVDAVSLGLLNGSTIDYTTELIGSSFRIVNNPQAKGSGCGCGISWEAKF